MQNVGVCMMRGCGVYAMSCEGVYDFYVGRINSARSYGLSGDAILDAVHRCAFWDSFLTEEESANIIKMCLEMHKKIMEDNYNAGWNENQ